MGVKPKKKSRKSKKVLSNKNIYGKKSATSQAGQIAALKYKVNKCYSLCKPEYKWNDSYIKNYAFTNSAGASVYQIWEADCCALASGTQDHQRIGDFVKSVSLKFMMTAQYTDNISGTPSNYARAVCARFIVLQYRKITTSPVPVMASILDDYISTGADYNLNMVSPFAKGITENYKILADKKFYLSYIKPILATKFKVRRPNNLRFDEAGDFNRIYCCLILSNLRFDSSQDYEADFQIKAKYTYLDK